MTAKPKNQPAFCYWCIQNSSNNESPVTFPHHVLIYPLLQKHFHLCHTSKGTEYDKIQSSIDKNDWPIAIRELILLTHRFFQSRKHNGSFNLKVPDTIVKINANGFKQYLEPYDSATRKLIWQNWCVIERDLRLSIVEKKKFNKEDYFPKFQFDIELHELKNLKT